MGEGGGGGIGLTLTGAAAVFTSSRNTAGIYATRGGIQGDIWHSSVFRDI